MEPRQVEGDIEPTRTRSSRRRFLAGIGAASAARGLVGRRMGENATALGEVPLARSGTRPGRNAVWVYSFADPEWVNATEIARLSRLGIDQVFLSVGPKPRPCPPKAVLSDPGLAEFITLAHGRGIRVHAMTLEDAGFAFPARLPEARALLEQVFAYNRAHPGATFDGIHVDVEPETLSEWHAVGAAGQERIMRGYVTVLQDLRSRIDQAGQNLEFSAAIGWFYDAIAGAGVPSAAPAVLATYAHPLVPMAYEGGERTTIQEVVDRVASTVQKAPTIVGIRARNFGTLQELRDGQDTLATRFGASANYLGTAVFKYEILPVQDVFINSSGDVAGNGSRQRSPVVFVVDRNGALTNAVKGEHNRLRARIHNWGTIAATGVRVQFAFAPVRAGLADAVFEVIGSRVVDLPGANGAGRAACEPADVHTGPGEREVEIDWYLDPADTNGGVWGGLSVAAFDRFCVKVTIDAGADDLYAGNNEARVDFVDVQSASPTPSGHGTDRWVSSMPNAPRYRVSSRVAAG